LSIFLSSLSFFLYFSSWFLSFLLHSLLFRLCFFLNRVAHAFVYSACELRVYSLHFLSLYCFTLYSFHKCLVALRNSENEGLKMLRVGCWCQVIQDNVQFFYKIILWRVNVSAFCHRRLTRHSLHSCPEYEYFPVDFPLADYIQLP
jgi:hypothetical protein